MNPTPNMIFAKMASPHPTKSCKLGSQILMSWRHRWTVVNPDALCLRGLVNVTGSIGTKAMRPVSIAFLSLNTSPKKRRISR